MKSIEQSLNAVEHSNRLRISHVVLEMDSYEDFNL